MCFEVMVCDGCDATILPGGTSSNPGQIGAGAGLCFTLLIGYHRGILAGLLGGIMTHK